MLVDWLIGWLRIYSIEASGRKEVLGELGVRRIEREKEDGGWLKQGMRERSGG